MFAETAVVKLTIAKMRVVMLQLLSHYSQLSSKKEYEIRSLI